MEEATRVAQFAGQVLVESYGRQPWILQAMEAVQAGVDRAIRQLGGGQQVQANMDPFAQGDEYRFPARTAQELRQTPQIAADQREVDPLATFEQLHDPAARQLGAPPPDEFVSDTGLTLPPEKEAPHGQGSDDGDGDRDLHWLF